MYVFLYDRFHLLLLKNMSREEARVKTGGEEISNSEI
jgi:hypothetical protein